MNAVKKNQLEQICQLHTCLSDTLNQFNEESNISDALLDDLKYLINDFIQSYKLSLEIEPFERYEENFDEFDFDDFYN